MTTSTMTFKQHNFPLILITLSILAAFFIVALAAVSIHALEKHGDDAIIASQCGDRPKISMVNPYTERIAHVCFTEAGWGIYITEKTGKPVTSFVKRKVKTLEQVVRYLHNAGYQILH